MESVSNSTTKSKAKASKKTEEKVSFLDESQRFIVLRPPRIHRKYRECRKVPNIHCEDADESEEEQGITIFPDNEINKTFVENAVEQIFDKASKYLDSEDKDRDADETAGERYGENTSVSKTAVDVPFESKEETDIRVIESSTFVIEQTEDISDSELLAEHLDVPESENLTISTQTDIVKPETKTPQPGYLPNDVDEIRSIWYKSKGIGLTLIPKWQKQCMELMDSVFKSYTVFSSHFQSANEILHQRIRKSNHESYSRLIILFWYVGLLISTLEPDFNSACEFLNQIHGNFIQVAQCSIDNLKLINQLVKKFYKMSKELQHELEKEVYRDFLARSRIVDEISDPFPPVPPRPLSNPALSESNETLTIISFGNSVLLESNYGRRKTRDLTPSQQIKLITCILQEILTVHAQVGNELRKAYEMLSKHSEEGKQLDSSIEELVAYLKYLRKYVGFRRNLGSLGFSSKFKSFQQKFLMVSLERDNTLEIVRSILVWNLQASETCLQQAKLWIIYSKLPSLSLKRTVEKSVRKLLENPNENDTNKDGDDDTSCIQIQRIFQRRRKPNIFDNLLSFDEMFQDVLSSNGLSNALEMKLMVEKETLHSIIKGPNIEVIENDGNEPEISSNHDLISSSLTTHSFEVCNELTDIDTEAELLNSEVLVRKKITQFIFRENSGVVEHKQMDQEVNRPETDST